VDRLNRPARDGRGEPTDRRADRRDRAAGPGRPPAERPEERTRLAWRRTTLATTVVGLLAIRVAMVPRPNPVAMLVLALVGAGWLGVLGLAHQRIGQLSRGRPAAVRRSPAALALLTAGYAILGAALLLR
jgi:Domain of unknown function (DUF202)